MDEDQERYWNEWEKKTVKFCEVNHIDWSKFEVSWHELNRIDGTPDSLEEIKKACFDFYSEGIYLSKMKINEELEKMIKDADFSFIKGTTDLAYKSYERGRFDSLHNFKHRLDEL